MSYYFNTKVEGVTFDETIEKVTEELQKEGFGVLTEIDVKATLKKKLDVDFKNYRILGACNPTYAHKALQKEDKVGVMLPCNIVVEETDGVIEVSAVDPIASMQGINNQELGEIATEIRAKLQSVINNI